MLMVSGCSHQRWQLVMVLIVSPEVQALALILPRGMPRALALMTPRSMLRLPRTRCSLLDEIRQEASVARGGVLSEQPVVFDGNRDDEAPFDIERWDQHRSSSRYSRLIPGILVGPTTRRISGTVAPLVVYSFLIGLYNDFAQFYPSTVASMDQPMLPWLTNLPSIQLPLTPFELTSPVLGLLLVFRTDTANDRFTNGCEAVWQITSSLRSIIRKLVVWSGRDKFSDGERLAALELIDACVLLHGWIMGSYLRGKPLKAVQEAQLLRFAAGRAENVPSDGSKVATTPYLAITAISIGVSRRLTSISEGQEVNIDDEFSKVTAALGKCENLLRVPIPLGYTRYSVRFLWLWLSLLPFALASTFADVSAASTNLFDKPQIGLAAAMMFVSFIFLSIEDIAVQIEEPFAILPLIKCHKWLMADVRRMRTLVRTPMERSSVNVS